MRRNGVELSKDVSVPESNGNVEPLDSTRNMILAIILTVAILSIIFIVKALF